MRAIASWEEVPIFDSETAEADFWAENKPDLRLMEASLSGSSEASESVTITLRIDPRMLARIKRLARSRYLLGAELQAAGQSKEAVPMLEAAMADAAKLATVSVQWKELETSIRAELGR